MNPWQAVDDFEAALCEYAGAPYAVAMNSCSAALLLAVKWCDRHDIPRPQQGVQIPRRTYVSVPMSILHAGCFPTWRDEDWRGVYQLKPFQIWDCALRFTSGMYVPGQYQCLSFAAAKILGIEQGGAILHDNAAADPWFRKMRFDGRTPGKEVADDDIDVLGHKCPMTPSVAAALTLRLSQLPRHNADQVREYPDVSTKAIFK